MQGPLANPRAAGGITSPFSSKMMNYILDFGEIQVYPNQNSIIIFNNNPRDKA